MYVDGFVVPVKKNKIEEYKKLATLAASVWKEYGALEYHECVADDVKPGKVTSFPQAVQLKPDETVVFSWITYKSKADRDAIDKKVMEDPRLKDFMDQDKVPMDLQRMFMGGFESIVDA